MRDVLPKGWVRTTLKQVVLYKKGKKPKNVILSAREGYIPYILIDEMEGKPIRAYTNDEGIPVASKYDVLIVWDGSIGKTARGIQGAIGSTIAALTPVIIQTEFLNAFLQLSKPIIEQTSRGTGLQHINPTTLWPLSFPLPPINEQKRLAEKLDHIMPKIDAVKERLERIPQIVKRFRQSVLTAAVTGKLTESWRENHPKVKSALDIIKSIMKKRLEDITTKSQTEKIREIYNLKEINDSDELPDAWKYTLLIKICQSFQYGTSNKSQKEGKIPVLRMGNLQNGKIDWNDLAFTSDEKEIEKYMLKSGDVLFNRTNSAELVGKTAIYLGEQKAIYAGYLIKINNYNELDSRYLNYVLNSQYARDYCKDVKSDGVNQSNINAQKLGRFEIPLPPLEEQWEIVRQVDRLFTLAGKFEAHYRKAKNKIDRLSKSVLAKTFRGELVPQDPNDEPAEKLLERIKEEKMRLEMELKKNRTKTALRKK